MNNQINFLKVLKDEFGFDLTETENGAATYKTAGSKLIDLFFKIGALRPCLKEENGNERLSEIIVDAFEENEDVTLKILLYGRDILNGAGERDVPRYMTSMLISHVNSKITKDNIEEYESKFSSLFRGFKEIGRWDDLIKIWYMLSTLDKSSFISYLMNEIILLIQTQLAIDMSKYHMGNPVSLLSKWMPSENASSKETKKIARLLRQNLKFGEENKTLTSEEYRKMLSTLRKYIKIVENNLRTKDYTFDYSKLPSKAMAKYSKAFNRNDKERFEEYINALAKGKTTINTKTLTPANICHNISRCNKAEEQLIDSQWKNMLNEFEELKDINAIVAADVSSSMLSSHGEAPINVSVGLALFFAYKATGPFANHFIDFCGDSRIHQINPNKSIIENYDKVLESSRDMNTNIDSVFQTLLNAARKYKVEQKDLPKYVIIVSDMEFDSCCSYSCAAGRRESVNFNHWNQMFSEHGYTLPTLIFWNAESRNDISPATSNDNVVLLSGRSSNGFKMLNILEKYNITNQSDLAFLAMLKTIERYNIYFEE